MEYQCEATGVTGFLSQLCRLIGSGHYFYFVGKIPDGKDVTKIDQKLIAEYDVAQPKWRRKKRYRGTRAGVHYIREGRTFLLLATHGKHKFFEQNQTTIRDFRRTALKYRGYSIRYTYSEKKRRLAVFIRLDRDTYQKVKGYLLGLATHPGYSNRERLEAVFREIPFVSYGPVYEQLFAILRACNRRRRYAGFLPIRKSAIRKRIGVAKSLKTDDGCRTDKAA